MGKIAIKGDSLRGKEVINLLKSLGGKNTLGFDGTEIRGFYYINDSGEILNSYGSGRLLKLDCFTLEEFFKKFPYKIDDNVIVNNHQLKILDMIWNGEEVEYRINNEDDWLTIEELDTTVTFEYKVNGKDIEIIVPNGKELSIENGKVLFKDKKSQYPKTYIECRGVINSFAAEYITGYKNELLAEFQKLIICRNAYWKIYGYEIGLGEPWEPNFACDLSKYYISFYNNKIDLGIVSYSNKILVFPTEEIRDYFYKNFKELIDKCKELL